MKSSCFLCAFFPFESQDSPRPHLTLHSLTVTASASRVHSGVLCEQGFRVPRLLPNVISALALQSALWMMMATPNIHGSPLAFFPLKLREAGTVLLLFLSVPLQEEYCGLPYSGSSFCNSSAAEKNSLMHFLKNMYSNFLRSWNFIRGNFLHSFSSSFHRCTRQTHWKFSFSHYLSNTQNLKAGNAMREYN